MEAGATNKTELGGRRSLPASSPRRTTLRREQNSLRSSAFLPLRPPIIDVLDLPEELLRGVPLPTLMEGGAKLFKNKGEVARTDPAGTFAKSRQVGSVTYFVSHS